MILSNEPGYYRDGAFGIRIENLIAVIEADRPAGGDDREMLAFETLTFVPIDRRLIVADDVVRRRAHLAQRLSRAGVREGRPAGLAAGAWTGCGRPVRRFSACARAPNLIGWALAEQETPE